MGEAKPWQFALFAAALLVLGGSIWYSLRDGRASAPDTVIFVDVTTGKLYSASISRSMIMPEALEAGGPGVLWPVYQEDDGSWTLSGRHLPLVEDETEGDISTEHVDLETGKLRPVSDRPERMSLAPFE